LEQGASGILTEEDPIRKRHLFPLPSTAMTGLTRWREAISEKQHFPIPQTFVLDLLAELPHADIADSTRKLAIPLHPFDVQIFEHYHLGAEWSIELGGLVDQLLDLLLGLFLLSLGFGLGSREARWVLRRMRSLWESGACTSELVA